MDTGWGGARKGSGRKEIPENLKLKGYTFQLTETDINFIESFEGKNRSDSLRNLIKEYNNLKKRIVISSGE
ncbi:hypothetical protein [Neobacillus sp. SuZ13]|uniref:hypothetical protein n=1 Tax=Neobacillus sp. SuZ13 TaxID=3047875 RepID=UPI0024C06BBB|nr:hypothetical protein [Neobacillus sp. SuZ13]WHY65631.1 hypothetical protein QNH17_21440 [Neobacillus sp. SuZ13]